MRKLLAAILVFISLNLCAQQRLSVITDTNGVIFTPTNFFHTNITLIAAEGFIRSGTSVSIPTNTASFTVSTNAFVIGTRYTNVNRRSFVSASFQLAAAAAGTAAVTLRVEHGGTTNTLKVSAGPLASLMTVEPLGLPVGPGAFYTFTDDTSGTGASVSIVSGTSSRTDW